ncbi:hypothetical protein TPHA_0D00095, partial [Tetrapisispora phaffii CBS 4417]
MNDNIGTDTINREISGIADANNCDDRNVKCQIAETYDGLIDYQVQIINEIRGNNQNLIISDKEKQITRKKIKKEAKIFNCKILLFLYNNTMSTSGLTNWNEPLKILVLYIWNSEHNIVLFSPNLKPNIDCENDSLYRMIKDDLLGESYAKLFTTLLAFNYDTTKHIALLEQSSQRLVNIDNKRLTLFIRATYHFIKLQDNVGRLNVVSTKNYLVWKKFKELAVTGKENELLSSEWYIEIESRLE